MTDSLSEFDSRAGAQSGRESLKKVLWQLFPLFLQDLLPDFSLYNEYIHTLV